MKSKFAKILGDYLVLTIASFIFAVAWEAFMIPNGMSAGGLMGLCTVIQFASGGAIPASISYIVTNAALILLSVLVFGVGFGFKSIYCIAVSSLMMELVEQMDFLMCIPGHFFFIRESFLVPVVAGILEGIGVGYIIKHGGSTGGTDIVALVVNKYWPVSLSKVFLVTDFVIVSLLLCVPGKSFADMIYGFEMMVTFSYVIDIVIGGQKSAVQLMVFSKEYNRIADYIIKVMDRGATVIHAQGWFTKSNVDVLLVLLSRNELPSLTSVIKQLDPKAFMSISPTNFVYGEGFEEIKTGIQRKENSNGNS